MAHNTILSNRPFRVLCWGGCGVGVLCWGRNTDGGDRHAEEREGGHGRNEMKGRSKGKANEENKEIKEREECHPEGGMEQGNIRGKM